MTIPRICSTLLVASPLVMMPFLLNIRWDAMMTPNEEPKWGLLLLLGLILSLAGSCLAYCNKPVPPGPTRSAIPLGLSVPGLGFLLFFLGLAFGLIYTVNPGEGINRLTFWYASSVTLMAVAWGVRNHSGYLRFLQIALIIAALILCSYFWVGFFVDFRNPEFNKFIHFSRIGHFNFTADVLVMLIPLLTWTVLSPLKLILRLAAGFSLASMLFMLMISGSLRGMGGLLVGGLVAGGLAATRLFDRTRFFSARPGRKPLLLVMLTLLLLGAGVKWVYQEMPKEYRDQIFMRGVWWNAPQEQDFNKAKSLPPLAPLWITITPYLGSRTPMWASTAGMIAEHPWLGFGTGSYLNEYPAFNKRYDLFGDYETSGIKIKTNPHNVLLQIASENGLPMALLFAGLYVWLAIQVMRQAWHHPDAFWLCGVWAIWAAGLDAQVNHVFFNPASLFIAAIALGVMYGKLPASKIIIPVPRHQGGFRLFLPALVSLIAIGLTIHTMRWVVSEYYVSQAIRLESKNPAASVRHIRATWETALAWSGTNQNAIFGLATFLNDMGESALAETKLREFLILSPHHVVGLQFLAIIQAKSGRLSEAAEILQHAVQLEPDADALTETLKEVRRAIEQKAATNPAQGGRP